MVRSCQPFAQNPNWGTTPCRLSMMAFQYIHSYPPYLETVSSIRNPRTRHVVVTRTHMTRGMKLVDNLGYYMMRTSHALGTSPSVAVVRMVKSGLLFREHVVTTTKQGLKGFKVRHSESRRMEDKEGNVRIIREMGCSDEKWNEMVQDYARWQL